MVIAELAIAISLLERESHMTVAKIVLTGGPCSGKTSTLSWLRQQLQDHGVVPFVVPEAARMCLENTPMGHVSPIAFQSMLMRTQMALEDSMCALAQTIKSDRKIVLCDRGTLDSKAYVTPEEFEQILVVNKWSVPQLRDQRYDAVLHLVTAADGAVEYYETDSVRAEDAQSACRLDASTRNAWIGQPHLRVIDNTTDFEAKKFRVLKHVLHTLGMPVPLEIERKYLIKRDALHALPEHAQCVFIEQGYLTIEDAQHEERVRMRRQGEGAVYYRAIKERKSTGVRIEREWQISEDEYHDIFVQCEPGAIIRKNRWCCIYENQYLEFDDFSPMQVDLCLLEIELTEITEEPSIPSWAHVIREVTGEVPYSNRRIAIKAP